MLYFSTGIIVGILLCIAGMLCELIFLSKVNKAGVVEVLRRKVDKNGGMAEIVGGDNDDVMDWVNEVPKE